MVADVSAGTIVCLTAGQKSDDWPLMPSIAAVFKSRGIAAPG